MLRISRKAESFTESVIREMNRLAVAAGAVSLAQGFPDFACPPELKAAVAPRRPASRCSRGTGANGVARPAHFSCQGGLSGTASPSDVAFHASLA